jgi:hypothetical protein
VYGVLVSSEGSVILPPAVQQEGGVAVVCSSMLKNVLECKCNIKEHEHRWLEKLLYSLMHLTNQARRII